MKLSVVIPAYNEEAYLPATLEALKRALAGIDDAEVIVVDNVSTDRTNDVARERGAKVITESARNIGRVRNTGAEQASGEVVVFLDADTLVAPGVFEKLIEAMADDRCLGGAVAARFEIPQKTWLQLFTKLWDFWGRLLRMRGGALQFCRRDVFGELGGYDSTIYVGEDIEFHWRLDKLAARRGAYTAFIEEPAVVTSSRRWDKVGLKLLIIGHPVVVLSLWRVKWVWKDWYENTVR